MSAQPVQPPKQSPQHECKPGLAARASAVVAATATVFVMLWQKMTKDGTLAAMGREMIKDIRNTMHEVFFGRSEHAPEPGTPLSPTQGEIAASRNTQTVYGKPSPQPTLKDMLREDSPLPHDRGSIYGHEQKQAGSVQPPTLKEMLREDGPSHDRGLVHGQEHAKGGMVLEQEEGKGFAEKEMERRQKANQGGNTEDQNERAKGRALPEEQREKQKEHDRNRGR